MVDHRRRDEARDRPRPRRRAWPRLLGCHRIGDDRQHREAPWPGCGRRSGLRRGISRVATYLRRNSSCLIRVRRWTRARAVSEGIRQDSTVPRSIRPYCAANTAHLLRLRWRHSKSRPRTDSILTAQGRRSPSPSPMDPETYVGFGSKASYTTSTCRTLAGTRPKPVDCADSHSPSGSRDDRSAVNTASITRAYTTVIAPGLPAHDDRRFPCRPHRQ